MSVVRGVAARRWVAVGLAVAVVCSLPAVIALWPTPAVAVEPDRLRELVLASAARPYQGYVDSQGHLDVPDLPVLGEVLALAGGSTRIRSWYAGPESWRVAVLTTTGERDIYRTDDGTYVWDFERNLIGFTPGELPIRLPWAADVVPPDLARRILAAAAPQDTIASIPARRVAGVVAAGLRLTPADPATTIGAVDIWADPVTGLPLRVQITGKGAAEPVLVTEFLDLDQSRPAPGVLAPGSPETAGLTVVSGEEVASAISQVAPVELPASLAGRPSLTQRHEVSLLNGQWVYIGAMPGIGAYGAGVSTFAALALPGRVGADALETARRARGTPITIGTASGYLLQVDVLTAVLIRTAPSPQGGRRRTYLLAGLVTPDLLRQAVADLLGEPR